MINSIRSKLINLSLAGGAALALTACQPTQTAEFSFPEGNAEVGKQSFIDLGCIACHTVIGAPDLRDNLNEADRTIVLGGEQTRVYTYGELVTSIVNPNHEVSQTRLGTMVQLDGESRMINYNDIMTISELIDLVTFLEDHYTLKPFNRTDYRSYTPAF